jgi:hypothetical protein
VTQLPNHVASDKNHVRWLGLKNQTKSHEIGAKQTNSPEFMEIADRPDIKFHFKIVKCLPGRTGKIMFF